MKPKDIILKLAEHQIVFKQLLFHKTESEYLWRPEPGKWNLLETVCHLLDEEREDFRARVKHTLETPSETIPPNDPEGWVSSRNYAAQDYGKTLELFLNERARSVAWLNTLGPVNWDNAYQHPKRGPMSAKLFLTNWLAHDYLHIRQIIRYNHQFLKEKTAIDLQYAGNW